MTCSEIPVTNFSSQKKSRCFLGSRHIVGGEPIGFTQVWESESEPQILWKAQIFKCPYLGYLLMDFKNSFTNDHMGVGVGVREVGWGHKITQPPKFSNCHILAIY